MTPTPEVKEEPLEGKDAWDIKIHIRMELLKVLLIKGLESRNVMGTILSYVDHSDEVISLMQRISHSSRAYIWNADALQGYLVKQNVIKILEKIENNKQKVKGWMEGHRVSNSWCHSITYLYSDRYVGKEEEEIIKYHYV